MKFKFLAFISFLLLAIGVSVAPYTPQFTVTLHTLPSECYTCEQYWVREEPRTNCLPAVACDDACYYGLDEISEKWCPCRYQYVNTSKPSAGECCEVACRSEGWERIPRDDWCDEGERCDENCVCQLVEEIPEKVVEIPKLEMEIKLYPGWNMISFPFKDYEIVNMDEIEDKIDRVVWSWDAVESDWDSFDIEEAAGRGIWVFAKKRTSIEMKGTDPLKLEDIRLYVSDKWGIPTPNQMPIPYDNFTLPAQRGNCKITKYYYYSARRKTWYKWERGPFLSVWEDRKWVSRSMDPFPVPRGVSIYIYTENSCRLYEAGKLYLPPAPGEHPS